MRLLGNTLVLGGQFLLMAGYTLFALGVLAFLAAPVAVGCYLFGAGPTLLAVAGLAVILLPFLPVVAVDPATPGSFWQRARRRRFRSKGAL